MIEITVFILSIIASALTAVFALPYDGAIYILYYALIELGYFIVIALLAVLFFYICTLSVNMKNEYDRPSKLHRFLMHQISFMVLRLTGESVKLKKEVELPDEPYFLVQNHVYGTDPLASMRAFNKKPVSFITKPENLKIPFAGPYMHRSCYYAIDRENPKNAIKTIIRATNLISKEHLNVGVYPEGTRNKTSESLLEFKDGCFKIALRAKCPIVVTVILGKSNKKKWPFKRLKRTITVVKVIPYEEFKDMNTQEISELTRNIMLAKINEKTA